MIIQDYIDSFKHQNPNLSPNTFKTMTTNLKRLLKIFNIDDIDDIGHNLGKETDYLKQPNEVVNKIKSLYALNTTIQTILAINKYLELYSLGLTDNDDDIIEVIRVHRSNFDRYMKVCCNRNQQIINENKLTSKEKNNWINYQTLNTMLKSYIDKGVELGSTQDQFYYYRNLLITSLFILIPPTRITNYQLMDIHYGLGSKNEKLATDRNWLLIYNDNLFLLFNQYKTSKHLGSVHKKIGDSPNELLLKTLFKKYLDIRSEIAPTECNILFINIYCSEIQQNKFTDILKQTTKKIFDKEISCDLFRKIFITNYMKIPHSITQNTETAKFMGQTYNATMMEKYRKIDTPDEKTNSVVVAFD